MKAEQVLVITEVDEGWAVGCPQGWHFVAADRPAAGRANWAAVDKANRPAADRANRAAVDRAGRGSRR